MDEHHHRNIKTIALAFDQDLFMVVITDLEGRIQSVNEAYTRRTGFTLADVQGTLAPVLDSDAADRWAALHHQRAWRGDFMNTCQNGDSYWEAVTILPILDDQGALVQWYIQAEDITAARQEHAERMKGLAATQFLHEASARLGSTLDLATIYEILRAIVGQIMPCHSLFVSAYTTEDNLIRCRAGWVDQEKLDVSQLPPIPLSPEGTGTQSIVIRSGQPLLLDDYQHYLQTANITFYIDNDSKLYTVDDIPEDEEVARSALIVPLKLGEQVIGVIQVLSSHLNAYTQDDLNILEALALHVAAATANAELYAQTQRELVERRRTEASEREQRTLAEALADTAATINISLDLPTVFERILANVDRVVPNDAATIALLEDGYSRFVHYHGYDRYGSADVLLSLRLPVGAYDNLRSMTHTGQPFIIDDTQQNPSWIKPASENALRAYLGAPIQHKDEVLGFISLRSETPGFFTPEHAARLQAFADQAAVAIRNARLFEAVQQYALDLEQRVAERTAALAASEEQAQAQYRGVPVPTYTWQYIPAEDDFELINFNDAAIAATSGLLFRLRGIKASQHHAQQPQLLEQLARTYSERTVLELETSYTYATTGVTRYLSVRTAFVAPDLVLVHTLDLTERKQAEQALKTALEREKELSDMKSRFISTVSHEFRTPLAIIQSSAEMLHTYSEKLSDDDKRTRFERIEDAVRRATYLLDNVLTISRSEAGQMRYNPVEIDVAALCEAVVSDVAPGYPGISISVAVTGSCTKVWADEQILRMIVANLISNAAKYSSPPDAAVTLTLECTDSDLVLTVRDEGIGIPASDQPRIFDTFYRGSNVHRRPGTGLGLSIARQGIEQHGGSITFTSEEGHGSTFTVRLPLHGFGVDKNPRPVK